MPEYFASTNGSIELPDVFRLAVLTRFAYPQVPVRYAEQWGREMGATSVTRYPGDSLLPDWMAGRYPQIGCIVVDHPQALIFAFHGASDYWEIEATIFNNGASFSRRLGGIWIHLHAQSQYGWALAALNNILNNYDENRPIICCGHSIGGWQAFLLGLHEKRVRLPGRLLYAVTYGMIKFLIAGQVDPFTPEFHSYRNQGDLHTQMPHNSAGMAGYLYLGNFARNFVQAGSRYVVEMDSTIVPYGVVRPTTLDGVGYPLTGQGHWTGALTHHAIDTYVERLYIAATRSAPSEHLSRINRLYNSYMLSMPPPTVVPLVMERPNGVVDGATRAIVMEPENPNDPVIEDNRFVGGITSIHSSIRISGPEPRKFANVFRGRDRRLIAKLLKVIRGLRARDWRASTNANLDVNPQADVVFDMSNAALVQALHDVEKHLEKLLSKVAVPRPID